MNYEIFLNSLNGALPSTTWSSGLQSIWWDAKGDWEKAHDIAQDMDTMIGCWLHAYLHRKEGDDFNAAYWYARAGKPFPKFSLEKEQETIIQFLL
ncbi:hypothetical protein [Spongiimicrobium salis]|uniref:hypothetical protein n=1 Tax=Spongiimicrobium salis TaxID=1667022 RepID=UPI00374DEA59